jgi:hypothetical protein
LILPFVLAVLAGVWLGASRPEGVVPRRSAMVDQNGAVRRVGVVARQERRAPRPGRLPRSPEGLWPALVAAHQSLAPGPSHASFSLQHRSVCRLVPSGAAEQTRIPRRRASQRRPPPRPCRPRAWLPTVSALPDRRSAEVVPGGLCAGKRRAD